MRSQRASGRVYGAAWPWRAAALIATVASAGLLGVVIAHWGWRWWVPQTPPSVPQALERWAPAIVAAPLFGRAAPAAAPVAASVSPAATDVRLIGVLAERTGGGYALFQRERGAVLVRAGQPIAAEVTLVEVHPDGVSIRDHGELRKIPVRASRSAAAPAGSAASGASAAPASPAPARAAPLSASCVAPPGYRGPVYRLNAELLSGVAAKPESWSTVVTPVAGGLSVRDESGFAAMLGMKSGDLMAHANGIALARVEDVLVAFVNPLLASQPVHVVGSRGGQPADWLFVNAGACPG